MSDDDIKVAYARFPDCGDARYGFLEGVRHAADRIEQLEAALREIDNMAPATCEVTLAHQMADCARAALDQRQENDDVFKGFRGNNEA